MIYVRVPGSAGRDPGAARPSGHLSLHAPPRAGIAVQGELN